MTRLWITLAVAFAAGIAPVWAELKAEQEQKLLPSNGQPRWLFGVSVAIDGDVIAVGGQNSTDELPRCSRAYVFTRQGDVWSEQVERLACDTSDANGLSVAVDDDTVLIGDYGSDNLNYDGGHVSVLIRQGGVWATQQRMTAQRDNWEYFGNSVSVDGDTALIGVPGSSDYPNRFFPRSGSAHVYTRADGVWTPQAQLVADDRAMEAYFGSSVSIDGDTALIGAPLDGGFAGAAYVFVRTGGVWTQQAKLLPFDGEAGDRFGYSVSLDGDTALIGARRDGDRGPNSGSAYVFTRTDGIWAQQAKLLASDGASGEFFGHSVSLDGDTALIGAPWNRSTYIFARTGSVWTQQDTLHGAGLFGNSVSLDGDLAVIGAPWDGQNGQYSGSAYVFRLFLSIAIDILPGSEPNIVAPLLPGVIHVALFGDDDFDVTTVDSDTLRFGPGGAEPTGFLPLPGHESSLGHAYELPDVNRDGHDDLIVAFDVQQSGIECGDTEAKLVGEMQNGRSFRGVDSIRTVGCE